MNKQKAFTLIELLVVIAVIGMLSSIIILSLGNARLKSRDAKRLADVNQVKSGLELFYNQAAGYPDVTMWTSGSLSCGPEKLMDVPKDPLQAAFYTYNVQTQVGAGCGTNLFRNYYVMFTTEGNTDIGPAGTYYLSTIGFTSSAPF